jgi:hypothetical protein
MYRYSSDREAGLSPAQQPACLSVMGPKGESDRVNGRPISSDPGAAEASPEGVTGLEFTSCRAWGCLAGRGRCAPV